MEAHLSPRLALSDGLAPLGAESLNFGLRVVNAPSAVEVYVALVGAALRDT